MSKYRNRCPGHTKPKTIFARFHTRCKQGFRNIVLCFLTAILIQKGNTIDRNNAKFTLTGKKEGGGFGVKTHVLRAYKTLCANIG